MAAALGKTALADNQAALIRMAAAHAGHVRRGSDSEEVAGPR